MELFVFHTTFKKYFVDILAIPDHGDALLHITVYIMKTNVHLPQKYIRHRRSLWLSYLGPLVFLFQKFFFLFFWFSTRRMPLVEQEFLTLPEHLG